MGAASLLVFGDQGSVSAVGISLTMKIGAVNRGFDLRTICSILAWISDI